MTNADGNSAKSWYLKTSEGSVYGPVGLEELSDWAGQGRIGPGDMVSQDEKNWVQAETVAGLKLEWMLDAADGSSYGPVHLSAIMDLVTDGVVPPGAGATNRSTGVVTSIDKLFPGPASGHLPAIGP